MNQILLQKGQRVLNVDFESFCIILLHPPGAVFFQDMDTWGFDTKALHTGYDGLDHFGATAVPIYGTASYEFENIEGLADAFAGTKPGHIYSRQSNPTVFAFEQRMAALENGRGAIGCASGMAALSTILLSLLRKDDELVAGSSLFGGSLKLFENVLSKFGVRTRYFDPGNAGALEEQITDKTKVVFMESLGNPALDIPDFAGVTALCENHNIPLVVDNTLPTPVLFRPGDYGAAIVMYSVTKFITGNGSAVGGVFVDTGKYNWSDFRDPDMEQSVARYGPDNAFLASTRRAVYRNTGGCMAPFHAYLHLLGLETLGLRMERHCQNALGLARYLQDSSFVESVNYPVLGSSLYKERAKTYFDNRGGGLLTLRLGTRENCFAFINRLRIAKTVANLGDAKSLVIHPASTIYLNCSDQERKDAGITDDLIRVSVGIENIEDIISDFDQALGF